MINRIGSGRILSLAILTFTLCSLEVSAEVVLPKALNKTIEVSDHIEMPSKLSLEVAIKRQQELLLAQLRQDSKFDRHSIAMNPVDVIKMLDS